ncbi:MAG TPA: citrate synthase family protein [Polyangiaceae bacterium]|nr:citrate synthase family protein [Polyangiaceae bacterium]
MSPPRRSRTAPAELLTARDAAALLDVKPASLYAYVSRGLLTSVPGPRGPSRLYARSEVERLKARHEARAGHGAVAAGALRFGEPVLESALTGIDARGPRYRGHVATELARADTPFEAVAELLWSDAAPDDGRLPPPFALDARALARAGERLRSLGRLVPRGEAPLSTLALVVAAFALGDAARFDAPPAVERARARELLRILAAAAALPLDPRRVAPALAAPSVAASLAVSLGARPTHLARQRINRALVVIADHELNPSSFAARVAASTGADLYACLGAALGALSGPVHGGATARVEALVAETKRPERAPGVIDERARRGDALPGFGHSLYPEGDPRATLLLSQSEPVKLAERTLAALVTSMRAARREPPNVDLGLVATALALGLPAGSAAVLFAVGRAAGWLAHVFEQRAAGFVLRPRARYTGPS